MEHQRVSSSRFLSQEHLKLLACLTMLLDHTAVILVNAVIHQAALSGTGAEFYRNLYELLRIIGRMAFPIYCFLLCEAAHFTRNSSRYGLRLLTSAILSELPFDLAFFGGFTWEHQSVMITLLLGFCAVELMERCPVFLLKVLLSVPFVLAAEYLHTDYGAKGVALIVLFSLTRELPHKLLWQFLGMWFLFSPNHLMVLNWLQGIPPTIQELCVCSIIPISMYSGRKLHYSKGLQQLFYLFYPSHILLLWIIQGILFI